MATVTLTPSTRGSHDRLFLLIGVLGLALTAGMLVSWVVATGIVLVGVGLLSRPLHIVPALVVVASAASFVNNEGGHLTRELSVVALLLLYAILCLLVAHSTRRWGLPRSPLTTALFALVGSTLLAAVHGILAGYNLRYLGLELLPLLGLTIALAVGGLRIGRDDLWLAFWVFTIVALGHFALGLYGYASSGVRRGGIYFTPIPGMLALLTFNLLLRTPSRRARWGLVLLTCVFILQQLISLTRGYWFGLVAGLMFSGWIFVGRGPGTGKRLYRLAGSLAMIGLFVVLASAAVATGFGWGNVASMFATRLSSSFGTAMSSETASNVSRLVEGLAALRTIGKAPWFGYGLGYELVVRHTFPPVVAKQWFIHQMYLWIWLKEGLVGLAAMLGVLGMAIRIGLRGAHRLGGEEAAWCVTAAGATVYIAVLGLTNYPLAMVNPTFFLAFLWGVALALDSPPRWWLAWRGVSAAAPDPGLG